MSTPSELDAFLHECRADVEARLEDVFAAELTAAGAVSPANRDLVDALARFTLRGGKRVRAALLRAGFRAVSADDEEPARQAAVCMELVQSFLLAHDDIVDRDDLRRGAPTLHRELAAWPVGVADDHLGQSGALLAGDLGAAMAARLLAGVPAPSERVVRASRDLQTMIATVLAGEVLDVAGSAGVALDRTQVLRVYELKTASYTVIGPLSLGALLAGADADQLAALAAVGRPLGVAFQILDDLLGLLGEPEQTGKPAGADLREGKQTLVLLEVRARASDAQRAAVEACLARDFGADELARARAAAQDCGAVEACRELAAASTAEALEALEAAPLREEGKRLIGALARRLLGRAS